jgi:membrane-associated phospholipid phosphatase
MTGLQVTLIQALQAGGAWLTAPMLFFSLLGQPEFFLLLIPLFYWFLDRRLGLRLALVAGISGSLSVALKIAFHLPRPYWVCPEVRALGSHPSFGFPSGHTQGAVTFWGLLAADVRRWWVTLLVVGLVLLVGVSRIYLGVHFATDVIAGVVFGGVILLGFLALEGPVGRRIAALPVSGQVLLAFAGSLLLAMVSFVALAGLGDWEVPAAWAAGAIERSGQSIHPLDPLDAVTAAGLFFGFAAGAAAIWPRQETTCVATRTRSLRLFCYSSGLLVTGAIWFGLGLLIKSDLTSVAYILHYLRAAIAAAWVSCGAPMVFARLNAETGGEAPGA